MKTASVIIPCFSGFYESIWHNSDTEYYLAQDIQERAEVPYDFKHLDDWYVTQDYYDRVGEAYTAEYIDLIQTYLNLDIELHFNCIHSPRFYNHATDEIYATFAWREDYDPTARILALMEKHHDQMADIIHRNHTSYSGFWSTMSNDYDKWLEAILDGDDDRYMSYAIMYLLRLESGINDLDEYIYEMAYVDPYDYFEPTTDEAKQEYDEYLKLAA